MQRIFVFVLSKTRPPTPT